MCVCGILCLSAYLVYCCIMRNKLYKARETENFVNNIQLYSRQSVTMQLDNVKEKRRI